MDSIKTVLIVEDSPGDARLLREMLDEGGHAIDLTHVTSISDAEKHLSENVVDMVLLDLGLPDVQGLAAIRRARKAAPRVPLVVLTGLDDETLARQALNEGAQDYLIKGQIDGRGLLRSLSYANERKRLEWMKDEFISTVSHELRTPLTSISSSLGLLAGNAAGSLPSPAQRLIAIAHANSKRLVRLVNDILDMEKLDSGQVVFNYRRLAVQAVVQAAIDENRGFAEGRGVRIELGGQIWTGDVWVDSDRLAQVLTNLLSNAILFSPPDSEVVVTIEEGSNVGWVRISVRDHGSGIPADFTPHVFERFAQADSTNTRQKGGTGLGLTIVKQIVDRLGGDVGFVDAPGGGTIFFVELPSLDHDDDAKDKEPDHGSALSCQVESEPRTGSFRILHVDDEPDIREIVEFTLALDPGLVVRSCASGADAVAIVAGWPPDMILCDVMMPFMDGPATLARLRGCPRTVNIPVVFMTARAQTSDREYFKSLGATGVITKPFDVMKLAGSVRHQLRVAGLTA